MKKIFLIVFCLAAYFVQAQNSNIVFTEYKDNGDGSKDVYFCIVGLNEDNLEAITQFFNNDGNISFSRIYKDLNKKDRCQLRINQSIDANYIRSLLLANDLDYDMSTVKELTRSSSNQSINVPASFPKFVDTGNPTIDNANYKAAKDKWISENPEAYKKMFRQTPLTDDQKKEKEAKEKNKKKN